MHFSVCWHFRVSMTTDSIFFGFHKGNFTKNFLKNCLITFISILLSRSIKTKFLLELVAGFVVTNNRFSLIKCSSLSFIFALLLYYISQGNFYKLYNCISLKAWQFFDNCLCLTGPLYTISLWRFRRLVKGQLFDIKQYCS